VAAHRRACGAGEARRPAPLPPEVLRYLDLGLCTDEGALLFSTVIL
jgi:hypothetical protein